MDEIDGLNSIDSEETTAVVETNTNENDANPFIVGGLAVVGVSIPIVIALIISIFKTKRRKKTGIETNDIIGLDKKSLKNSNNIYNELMNEINVFKSNIELHKKLKDNLFYQLRNIELDFVKLWNLAYSDEIKRQSVAIKYTDIFRRLNNIVGIDYWASLVNSSSNWDNVYLRKTEVRNVVNKIHADLIKNIRNLNSTKVSFDPEIDVKLLSNYSNDLFNVESLFDTELSETKLNIENEK